MEKLPDGTAVFSVLFSRVAKKRSRFQVQLLFQVVNHSSLWLPQHRPWLFSQEAITLTMLTVCLPYRTSLAGIAATGVQLRSECAGRVWEWYLESGTR